MYTPSRSEFLELAQQGNLIPVYREVIADLETPVSAMAKLGTGAPSFLLESVEGGENLGRYSFLGCGAHTLFRSVGNAVEVTRSGRTDVLPTQNPLVLLRQIMSQYQPVPVSGLPRFYGGAVGYMGYEMVRFFERVPTTRPDELGLPDALFMLTDVVVAFDHVRRVMKVIATADLTTTASAVEAYELAVQRIEETLGQLQEPSPARPLLAAPVSDAYDPSLEAHFAKDEYLAAVEAAKEYIRAGDIFQVVLSQRFSSSVSASPFDNYRWLRTVNPSPYLFYLNFGEVSLVGSSPEVMVRLEGTTAHLRPIAGTRRRGETEERDRELEAELLASEKERAEHLMLVDLGRNDLGRVCRFGTVQVKEFMVIERYSHVMHLVSDVTGELEHGKDAIDLIQGTFPAGTVSGAPKVRAMEIIDELEPTRRGVYAGAVGYIGYSGNMDTCIALRTMIVKDGRAYVQAGAGIVADSDPEAEYFECMHKAGALFRAIELAELAAGKAESGRRTA